MLETKKLAGSILVLLLAHDLIDRAQYIPQTSQASNQFLLLLSLRISALFAILTIFFRNLVIVKREMPAALYFVFLSWCIWSFATLAIGAVTAQDYWEWKFLLTDNLFRLSIQYSVVVGLWLVCFRVCLTQIFRSFLVLTLAILPFSIVYSNSLYAYTVVPVTLVLLVVPFLTHKLRYLTILVAIFSVVFAIEFRVNALRVAMSLCLFGLFYFRRYLSVRILKLGTILLFLVPVILLFTALSGAYNPFLTLENTNFGDVSYTSGSLVADTRTFLYAETFKTLDQRGSFLFGEGAAGSYESIWKFSYLIDSRRFGTEVGFLNVLLHTGIIGVAIIFLIFSVSSFYGVFRSNNFFSKMLGLTIGFRWVIFFIEDPTAFNMNMFFLWITIGLAASKTLRLMSDEQIKQYFRGTLQSNTNKKK